MKSNSRFGTPIKMDPKKKTEYNQMTPNQYNLKQTTLDSYIMQRKQPNMNRQIGDIANDNVQQTI